MFLCQTSQNILINYTTGKLNSSFPAVSCKNFIYLMEYNQLNFHRGFIQFSYFKTNACTVYKNCTNSENAILFIVNWVPLLYSTSSLTLPHIHLFNQENILFHIKKGQYSYPLRLVGFETILCEHTNCASLFELFHVKWKTKISIQQLLKWILFCYLNKCLLIIFRKNNWSIKLFSIPGIYESSLQTCE